MPISPIFRYVSAALAVSGATIALAAGLQVKSATTSKPHAKPQHSYSVQQTMLTEIDPEADALWDSVGTFTTKKGTEHRAPHTDAQWARVGRYAQTIISGSQHLQAPGLRIGSTPHSALSDGNLPGARTGASILADINADPARWQDAAHRLEVASQQALEATKIHDAKALFNAGGDIDAACEHCHEGYWYPHPAAKK